MQRITRKELEERNFKFHSYYGEYPVYHRDGFGYLFKEREDTLEQIMPGYVIEKIDNEPIGYLKRRMQMIDEGQEMGLNQLCSHFSYLPNICQLFEYKGTIKKMDLNNYKS